MRDASVGIPWMGSGAAENAAFMLVREVSVVVVMVPGPGGGISSRELSRDLKKRYS